MVDADRPNCRAIERNEHCVLSPLEISSRSERLSAFLGRCRIGGRMPPVGESPKIPTRTPDQIGVRSNSSTPRPASDPRSQTAERMSSRCDVVASWSTLHLAKRLVCCADQLNPPPIADIGQGRSKNDGISFSPYEGPPRTSASSGVNHLSLRKRGTRCLGRQTFCGRFPAF